MVNVKLIRDGSLNINNSMSNYIKEGGTTIEISDIQEIWYQELVEYTNYWYVSGSAKQK